MTRSTHRPAWLAWSIRLLVLIGLLGLTGWNVTRSDALSEARAAYERGAMARCLGRALDHLDRRPWSREAHKLAALSLSRLDYAEEAEDHYAKAGPLSNEERHTRALGIVRANKREEAIAAYRDILEENPDDPLALSRLAAVYLSRMQIEEGVELAERLTRIPGWEVHGWTMAGTFYHRLKEPERAVAAFDQVLRLDPKLDEMNLPAWQFWLYYGENLLVVGRIDEARRHLERALRTEEDHVVLLNLLGSVYEASNQPEDAELTYRRALTLEPKSYTALLNLGRLVLKLGRPEEAIGFLERASEENPDAYAPVYNLILAHRRLGHTEDVVRLRERLAEIQDDSGTPTKRMGGSGRAEASDAAAEASNP